LAITISRFKKNYETFDDWKVQNGEVREAKKIKKARKQNEGQKKDKARGS
jgi:hypothetical protein